MGTGVARTLKAGIRSVAGATGLTRFAARSRWRADRLLILCYHGISLSDEHEWDPELFIAPQKLRRRLRALRGMGASVLSLAEGLDRLRARDLPPLAVALTFDDGTHDFWCEARPILKEFGYPATVYLTTYYCLDQRPVFNPMCAYMLWLAAQQGVTTATVPGLGPMRVDSVSSRRSAWTAILDWAARNDMDAEQKDSYLDELGAATDVDTAALRERRILHIMSPDEVRGLDASIDVQLHTHRHRAPLERSAFLREIEENRAVIAELRPGAPEPTHYCYPSGVVDPAYEPWLREAGVVSATTCEPGLAGPASHSMQLPRFVDTSPVTDAEFEAWVAGAGEWMSARFWARRGHSLVKSGE